MILLIFLNVAVLLFLSGVHVYWAFGGQKWATDAVPFRMDGNPVFRPGIGATLIVAASLLVFAILIAANVSNSWIPRKWSYYGTCSVGTIFLLRAVGEFRYVGLFKRIRNTTFARKDTIIYTPLCIFIAISCCLIAFFKL